MNRREFTLTAAAAAVGEWARDTPLPMKEEMEPKKIDVTDYVFFPDPYGAPRGYFVNTPEGYRFKRVQPITTKVFLNHEDPDSVGPPEVRGTRCALTNPEYHNSKVELLLAIRKEDCPREGEAYAFPWHSDKVVQFALDARKKHLPLEQSIITDMSIYGPDHLEESEETNLLRIEP